MSHLIAGSKLGAPRHPIVARAGQMLALRILARVGQMLALRRSRTALAALDDAGLRDIGLTRAEAEREAAGAFWDVPCRWIR